MTTNNIATIAPKPLVAALPNVEADEMVAVIAAELPPKLPDGVSLVDWIARTEATLGQHPRVVFGEAIQSLMSTFRFSPTKAEMIDHILDAYRRLQLPLSDDARRHLSYRQKLPDRYTLNADGVKRFAEDAKVTAIGYFSFQGPQANIILDAIQGAIVEDVEKAIAPVQASFAKADKDKINGEDVLRRFRTEVRLQGLYREFGAPDRHCGGPVAMMPARSGMIPLTSNYLALSQSFVDRMRDQYPHARWQGNVGSWADAMKNAFWAIAVSRDVDPATYGSGLQQQAEAMIDAKMSDLNREGKIEIERDLQVSRRVCIADLANVALAEQTIRSGGVSIIKVTIRGEIIKLDTLEACEVARRKLDTFSASLDSKLAELAAT